MCLLPDMQVQIVDRVVEMPVVKERKVPMVQTVQKTVEVPEVQIIDVVEDVPVVKETQKEIHDPIAFLPWPGSLCLRAAWGHDLTALFSSCSPFFDGLSKKCLAPHHQRKGTLRVMKDAALPPSWKRQVEHPSHDP